MKSLLLLTFSLFSPLSEGSTYLPAQAELKMVVEFSRHGSRTSGKNLFQVKQPELFKGKELLTPFGYQEHVQLGRKLKQIYGDFLPETYDPTQILIISTEASRCAQSAEAQIRGMYHEGEITEHDDYRDKFDIQVMKNRVNFLLHLYDENCDRFEKVQKGVKNSYTFKDIERFYVDKLAPVLQQHADEDVILAGSSKDTKDICTYFYWA
jgi:hypothetical protein